MLWLQHSSFPEKRGAPEKGNAGFTLVASASRQHEGRLVLRGGGAAGVRGSWPSSRLPGRRHMNQPRAPVLAFPWTPLYPRRFPAWNVLPEASTGGKGPFVLSLGFRLHQKHVMPTAALCVPLRPAAEACSVPSSRASRNATSHGAPVTLSPFALRGTRASSLVSSPLQSPGSACHLPVQAPPTELGPAPCDWSWH